MIGKFTKGSNSAGLLNYCYYEKLKLSKADKSKLTLKDVRGELIYIQNLALNHLPDGRFDVDDLAKQIDNTANLNRNLKDFMWHQSFSFPLEENPDLDILENIILDFVEDFGFKDNQLVAFKHTDKNHQHFHIVGNRINVVGKTTASDSFCKLKIGEFCRKSETKYGLEATVNMTKLLPKNERIEKKATGISADKMRAEIEKAIKISNSMETFKRELLKNGIKANFGRGITFVDKSNGSKINGSSLGREYSLMYLQNRMGTNSHNLEFVGDNVKKLEKGKEVFQPTQQNSQIKASNNPNIATQSKLHNKPEMKQKSKNRFKI